MTERLLDSAASDAIDALLRDLRVSSTVLCRSRLGAPWGFGVLGRGRAVFHVVTAGDCWLEVDGEPSAARLAAGDLAILTRGRTHWLRDDPHSETVWLDDLLAANPVEPDRRLSAGGDGPVTDLLCGAFAIEGNGYHPMLNSLPPVIYARGEGGSPLPWMAATISLVQGEMHAPGQGSVVMLERACEILLGQALRASMLDVRDPAGVDLEVLSDRGIAPAVRAVLERPEHHWSVGELAALCSHSRSSFVERFRQLTGESPIRFVTRCRLARAAGQLRTTSASVGEVAHLAGYESAFAFSRAFKRAFGVSPQAYRAQRRGAKASPPG